MREREVEKRDPTRDWVPNGHQRTLKKGNIYLLTLDNIKAENAQQERNPMLGCVDQMEARPYANVYHI